MRLNDDRRGDAEVEITSLTNEVLSALNWRVDGDDKEEPASVAESYLSENGFIGG